MAEQENKSSGMRTLIVLVICCAVLYFWVILTFPKSIECKKGTPLALCDCIRPIINKNVPFFDKLRIRITGATTEELNTYVDAQDLAKCLVLSQASK